MIDQLLEQQKRNEVMPKNARDPYEARRDAVAWEQVANIPVMPRRVAWRTPGQDDLASDAQASTEANETKNESVTNNVTITTTGGGVSLPSGGSVYMVLQRDASGQAVWDYVRAV